MKISNGRVVRASVVELCWETGESWGNNGVRSSSVNNGITDSTAVCGKVMWWTVYYRFDRAIGQRIQGIKALSHVACAAFEHSLEFSGTFHVPCCSPIQRGQTAARVRALGSGSLHTPVQVQWARTQSSLGRDYYFLSWNGWSHVCLVVLCYMWLAKISWKLGMSPSSNWRTCQRQLSMGKICPARLLVLFVGRVQNWGRFFFHFFNYCINKHSFLPQEMAERKVRTGTGSSGLVKRELMANASTKIWRVSECINTPVWKNP